MDLYIVIIFYVWIFKTWLFSFLSSLLCYLCVVHKEKLKSYGMDRVERIFRILSWAIPAVLVALHHSLRTDYDPSPWVNQCYGWSQDGPYSARNWFDQLEGRFCAYNDYGFSNHYIENGLRVVCGINVGLRILLFSNLSEAFIYYRIYAHLKK